MVEVLVLLDCLAEGFGYCAHLYVELEELQEGFEEVVF